MATKRPQVPAMSTSDMASAMSKAGFSLFAERTGLPLNKAQRNLNGRTTYAEDSELKKEAIQIHDVHVMDDGLILGLVTSFQKGATPAAGRAFRTAFFDLFGRRIEIDGGDEPFETQKQAMSAFWKQADEIDAVEETREGVKARCEMLSEELDKIKALQDELKE